MSAPDWRDVFAKAVYQANHAGNPAPEDGWELWWNDADAILAAIAERGYRLHRDHDWKHNPHPLVAALDYPKIPMKCGRCGILSGSIRDSWSCEGGA